MKIKITEIEASAEELKASNSVADGFMNLLRNAFNPFRDGCDYGNDDDENEEVEE